MVSIHSSDVATGARREVGGATSVATAKHGVHRSRSRPRSARMSSFSLRDKKVSAQGATLFVLGVAVEERRSDAAGGVVVGDRGGDGRLAGCRLYRRRGKTMRLDRVVWSHDQGEIFERFGGDREKPIGGRGAFTTGAGEVSGPRLTSSHKRRARRLRWDKCDYGAPPGAHFHRMRGSSTARPTGPKRSAQFGGDARIDSSPWAQSRMNSKCGRSFRLKRLSGRSRVRGDSSRFGLFEDAAAQWLAGIERSSDEAQNGCALALVALRLNAPKTALGMCVSIIMMKVFLILPG